MSNSYHHNVRCCNNNRPGVKKYYKKQYNKFFRKTKFTHNGSYYKKLISHYIYNLHQWNVYVSKYGNKYLSTQYDKLKRK